MKSVFGWIVLLVVWGSLGLAVGNLRGAECGLWFSGGAVSLMLAGMVVSKVDWSPEEKS